MSLRTMSAFCIFSISQISFAASQPIVTAYGELQKKLVLQSGQTYLAFMQKQVKPALDSFEEVILNDPAMQAKNYRQLQKNLIAQGAGVAIRIDSQNYIFNIGYLDGSDPENDVKSGRSYSVGPKGTESDPSDLAYLKGLEAYLTSEPQSAGDFIEALMRVITNCDSSVWSHLSIAGQSVATDFLAIYTAELDRHLMVKLNPRKHPWEVDLAAATFISLFNTASGLMMQDGALVPGSIQSWWAQGRVGSGIGETRRDRIRLQKLIARAEHDSREADEISKLVGEHTRDDVIQGVLEYLNSSDAPQDMTGGEGELLTYMIRNYLVHVQAHSDSITALAE